MQISFFNGIFFKYLPAETLQECSVIFCTIEKQHICLIFPTDLCIHSCTTNKTIQNKWKIISTWKQNQTENIFILGNSTVYLHQLGHIFQGIQVASLMPINAIRACKSTGWLERRLTFFFLQKAVVKGEQVEG